MNHTATNYKRRHISRNFYTTSGVLHPETAQMMFSTGLTPELMEAANTRRRWIAYRKIHRIYEKLKRVRIGYISIREIAIAAKAARETVKAALEFTLKHISLQLAGAFGFGDIHTPNNIKILGCASAAKTSVQQVKTCASRTLRTLQEKWMKRSEDSTPVSQVGVVKGSTRQQEERELAERFMESLKQPAKNQPKNGSADGNDSDKNSVKMSAKAMMAYLKRGQNPGHWLAQKERLTKLLHWKKTDTFPTEKKDMPTPIADSEHARAIAREDADIAARKAASAYKPRNTPRPPEIDWEAARLADEELRREKYSGGQLKDKPATSVKGDGMEPILSVLQRGSIVK